MDIEKILKNFGNKIDDLKNEINKLRCGIFSETEKCKECECNILWELCSRKLKGEVNIIEINNKTLVSCINAGKKIRDEQIKQIKIVKN